MSSGAIARLRKEYTRLLKEPPANIEAKPLETNILEWHYVLNGPKGTIFEGGEYHGRIVFPKDYPFKPPGIYIMTPNGVFDTQVKVCLSMSDYHPETWNPLWSVNRYVFFFSLRFAVYSRCHPLPNIQSPISYTLRYLNFVTLLHIIRLFLI